MKNEMIKFGIILIIVGIFLTQGFSQTEKFDQDFRPVTLKGTEIRTLHSNIVDQDYELLISLPVSYQRSHNVYPVIFLLDPFMAFSIVKGYTDYMTTAFSLIPEVIIVGIGYGGKGGEELLNWALGRTRDLTPVEDSLTAAVLEKQIANLAGVDVEVHTGGAGLFLEFIEEELFPFIESNYRTDTNHRTLIGYSFGGLFTLYTLFQNPGLFNSYLIGSPSIHYKDEIIFKYESDYAKNHTDLNADVFMSVGELEKSTSVNIRKIEELLSLRNYKNLKLKTVVFEDEDHYTCGPAALSRGINELMDKEDNQ